MFGNHLQKYITPILGVLLTALILGICIYIIIDSRNVPKEASGGMIVPDLVFSGTEIVSSQNGEIVWRMRAGVLEQMGSTSYVVIKDLEEWIFFDGSSEKMKVSAASGRITKTTQEVQLDGPVEVLFITN